MRVGARAIAQRRWVYGFAATLSLTLGCTGAPDAAAPWIELSLETPVQELEAEPTLRVSLLKVAPALGATVVARAAPDGTILVSDNASGIVRVSADGVHVEQVARAGRGPGELEGTFVLDIRHDTTAALGQPPSSDGSITLIPDHGEPARVSDRAGQITAMALLSDGVLVQRGAPGFVVRTRPKIGDHVTDSTRIGIARGSFTTVDTIVWLTRSAHETYLTHPQPRSRLGFALSPSEFLPHVSVVAAGNQVWFVDRLTGDVERYDDHGNALRSLSLGLQRRPFDAGMRRQAMLHAMSDALTDRDSARITAVFGRAALPDSAPLVSGFVRGPGQKPWIRLFDTPGSATQTLVELSDRGVARAVRLPAGLSVQEILDDAVIGIENGSDDEPYLVRYRLRALRR